MTKLLRLARVCYPCRVALKFFQAGHSANLPHSRFLAGMQSRKEEKLKKNYSFEKHKREQEKKKKKAAKLEKRQNKDSDGAESETQETAEADETAETAETADSKE